MAGRADVATPVEEAKEVTSLALTEANKGLELLEGFSIDSDEEQNFAAELLQEVKGQYSDLETQRKKITGPMNAAVKEVNNFFRPAKTALEKAERIIKEAIAGYLDVKEEKNRELLAAAEATDDVDEAMEALAAHQEVVPPKGVSVRHKWKVEEVIAEDLVPYQFCSPDLSKIEEYANDWSSKHGGDVPCVPGVKFVRKPIVSSRKR